FLYQTAQLMVCNCHHSVEQRLARWLLMIHDRAYADRFPITHEAVSHMLGVSRPSVSLASARLQEAGLIHCSRGLVTIADPHRLATTSCECYQSIRNEYARMLG
ncbi:MAG TPA: helix-turn-helix domain-containing protein, partial [Chloroflexota bacterium]